MKKTYRNTDIAELISEYIHSKRDREIIADRLIDGMMIKELADKYHLTERQIQRIIKKADVFLVHII